MPETFVVYAIAGPRGSRTFYIGYTSAMAYRKQQHLEGGHSIGGLKIQQITANGCVPIFLILEICPGKKKALRAVAFRIEAMRTPGAEPLNNEQFDTPEARALLRKTFDSSLAAAGKKPAGRARDGARATTSRRQEPRDILSL